MSALVRLLGDTHGNMTPVRQASRLGLVAVHLGDLGFAREWAKASRIPNLHVVAGNHDEIPFARATPVFAGDFGDLGERVAGASGVFFARGAESLDRELRTPGKDWWPEEQLSNGELDAALDAYLRLRPHTVLSHEAPTSVVRAIHGDAARPSRTSETLQAMLEACRPERWSFGHHHVSWSAAIAGTEFIGLGIDEVLDVVLG